MPVSYTHLDVYKRQLKTYLASGGQCYVVCPLVEESEAIDSKAATSIYAGMKSYFSGHRCV